MDKAKTELALDLFSIGAVKFGEFTYASGATGPMYIDLRLFISYPKILKKVTKLYVSMLSEIKFDRLAGVAYAGLPIAGAISLDMNKPWIFMRKEATAKNYGLKKSLEGEYKKGERIVMIEDICNRASSLLTAIPKIEEEGLVIKDAVVLLDYQKGGSEALKDAGYTLHSFMSVLEVVEKLHEVGKIETASYETCKKFLTN
jgi:uridine monophosphate synthetase